ncbi:3-hydroxybutyryl-CoA dehydrogenase [Shewanella colwelliana]|uniref:3-hydroxybutyryl-CoA dehydrogenase n=1 Tax=Shewanella colwelliana TaxID=23 RepID=A0A1E5IVG8_SHECO|nr:3-hydroxyacyl-CoA dehydrogenase NAD-binding domain-containing protein [Shewanella colwelliana]OEG74525.1 3-hydroxybutyryl-CoA dehydrogenase [Shewanella colwelliana]
MKVVVIGSGTMGTGIAQALVVSDSVSQLVVIAREQERLDSVMSACSRHIKRYVKVNSLVTPLECFTDKLKFSTSFQAVEDADIVIEAVAEITEVKKRIFESIRPFVQPSTIVASNTSSLSITEFANLLDCPENLVGMHFFNPAPIMELVEIVRGLLTSEETVKAVSEFAEQLGKKPVLVNEAPGFVVNRMLIPMINEAISILAEGVATAEDIDKAMKFGAHHPMGPLALADLIGNDVNLSIMETLHSETGDPKYRAHPLLRKMVRANLLGRKTKKGFFEY